MIGVKNENSVGIWDSTDLLKLLRFFCDKFLAVCYLLSSLHMTSVMSLDIKDEGSDLIADPFT